MMNCAVCDKELAEGDLVLSELDAGLVHVACSKLPREGDHYYLGEPFVLHAADWEPDPDPVPAQESPNLVVTSRTLEQITEAANKQLSGRTKC